jgi:hypothetical protein
MSSYNELLDPVNLYRIMRRYTMAFSEDLTRFENDVKSSSELQAKVDEICSRLEDKEKLSPGELLAKAGSELGYGFSAADVEQLNAELEDLDPEEMEAVSGGHEDEYGHDAACLTAWHCEVVTLHTETKKKTVNCWSDFSCESSSKNPCDVNID